MNNEYVIPLRTVAERFNWSAAKTREMIANPDFPTKEIDSVVMTTPYVLEYLGREKPAPIKNSYFNVPVGTYAAMVNKTVEEIEKNGYPEVRTLDNRKYVSYVDYDYYLENRPRKPTVDVPRYSDDL